MVVGQNGQFLIKIDSSLRGRLAFFSPMVKGAILPQNGQFQIKIEPPFGPKEGCR
jgi:hypothetical protein